VHYNEPMITDENLWQSLEWKKYQESLGREVKMYKEGESSALVVIDKTIGGYSTWEITRGPLAQIDNGQLIIDNGQWKMITDAKKDKCFALYLSPQNNIPDSGFRIPNSSGLRLRHKK